MEEFYRSIKQVPSDALEFHLYRGDFENWLKQVIGDDGLAETVSGLKAEQLHGEDLRKALLKVFDAKYGIRRLTLGPLFFFQNLAINVKIQDFTYFHSA